MSETINKKKLKKTITARLESLRSEVLVIVNTINLARQNIATLEVEHQRIVGKIKENENWEKTFGTDEEPEDE